MWGALLGHRHSAWTDVVPAAEAPPQTGVLAQLDSRCRAHSKPALISPNPSLKAAVLTLGCHPQTTAWPCSGVLCL